MAAASARGCVHVERRAPAAAREERRRAQGEDRLVDAPPAWPRGRPHGGGEELRPEAAGGDHEAGPRCRVRARHQQLRARLRHALDQHGRPVDRVSEQGRDAQRSRRSLADVELEGADVGLVPEGRVARASPPRARRARRGPRPRRPRGDQPALGHRQARSRRSRFASCSASQPARRRWRGAPRTAAAPIARGAPVGRGAPQGIRRRQAGAQPGDRGERPSAKRAAAVSSRSSGQGRRHRDGDRARGGSPRMPSRTAPRLARRRGRSRRAGRRARALVDAGSAPVVAAMRAGCRTRPRSARCSRAGCRPWPRRAAARAGARGGGRERRQLAARCARTRRRRAPSRRPSRSARARPPPLAGRAPGTASALASSSSSWTSAAHAAPASSTRARNTRWSPATAPVCAAAAPAPAGEVPTLSTATPTPRSAHSRQRLQSGPRRRRPRGRGRSRRRPPPAPGRRPSRPGRARPRCRRTRPCEPQAAPRGQRVDGDVAALGDERDAPGSSGRSASPQSAARSCSATMPLPLGPQTGSRWRAAASASSRSSAPALARPRRSPRRRRPRRRSRVAPACSMTAGTPAAGIATTTASGGLGQVGQRREARHPVSALAARVHAPDLARVAGRARLRASGRVRAVAVGRADDRDRARMEQAGEVHRG